jgi:hypothetical protein
VALDTNTPPGIRQNNRENQLPAEPLATLPCKSHIFINMVGEVIISEEK